MKLTKAMREYFAEIGARGGHATLGKTSKAKAEAARKNGARGGRPRVENPSKSTLAKRRSREKKN